MLIFPAVTNVLTEMIPISVRNGNNKVIELKLPKGNLDIREI